MSGQRRHLSRLATGSLMEEERLAKEAVAAAEKGLAGGTALPTPVLGKVSNTICYHAHKSRIRAGPFKDSSIPSIYH